MWKCRRPWENQLLQDSSEPQNATALGSASRRHLPPAPDDVADVERGDERDTGRASSQILRSQSIGKKAKVQTGEERN